MSLIANGAGESAKSFYNGVATQSLRLNDDDNADLTRTPSSASNRKTFVISTWLKRANLGTNQAILGAFASSYADFFRFNSSSELEIAVGNNYQIGTNAVFRDVSSWYHVVLAFDVTQSTDTNRIKIYVNGESQSLKVIYNAYPANSDYAFNNTVVHTVGGLTNFSGYQVDGYLSEYNFIDGLSFFSDTSGTANTSFNINSFGELKNGVWIAKKYTGSYGTNGFRLQFNQTGTGTASTSTIGADTSGNTHHFTSSGIVASDCSLLDSPENNFATLNVLDLRGTVTASEGNLKADLATNGNITATIAPTSGKWYWECYLNDITNPYIGVQSVNTAGSASSGYSQDAVGLNNAGDIYYDASSQSGAFEGSPAWTANDIVSVAYDVDNNKIWWALNGQFYSANASSESTIAYSVVEAGNSAYDLSSQVTHGVAFLGSSASNGIVTMNFGQDASFAGELTGGDIGDATDENGIGVFKYAPPSGFLALCTSNLPEPTISPNALTQADDHFNSFLFTGNGGADRSLALNTFTPDWSWLKSRSGADNHVLIDSSRRNGANYPNLHSNTTAAEANDAFPKIITDGIITSEGLYNNNNVTFVAFNWKANGGTTSSNSDGSITSTVQANTDAGFSIVTYTGDNGSSATIGHGLGAVGVPKMIIVKMRNGTNHWAVYHQSLGNTKSAYLSLTQAPDTNASFWNNTSPTSSIFTIGTDNIVNASQTYVAYCFSEIESYSRFGSYTGNGSTDGTFVFTGFRPAFVMIKRTNGTGSWNIADTKRSPENEVDEQVQANLNNAESTSFDFDFFSNGFKARTTDSARNANGGTYIYMAFAEAPFKYANAR